mgnify:CR=1 FL=1
MNKIFLAIIFIFFSTQSFAEWVETEGSYVYAGDISRNEGCKLAKDRAKLKALEKVLAFVDKRH